VSTPHRRWQVGADASHKQKKAQAEGPMRPHSLAPSSNNPVSVLDKANWPDGQPSHDRLESGRIHPPSSDPFSHHTQGVSSDFGSPTETNEFRTHRFLAFTRRFATNQEGYASTRRNGKRRRRAGRSHASGFGRIRGASSPAANIRRLRIAASSARTETNVGSATRFLRSCGSALRS